MSSPNAGEVDLASFVTKALDGFGNSTVASESGSEGIVDLDILIPQSILRALLASVEESRGVDGYPAETMRSFIGFMWLVPRPGGVGLDIFVQQVPLNLEATGVFLAPTVVSKH